MGPAAAPRGPAAHPHPVAPDQSPRRGLWSLRTLFTLDGAAAAALLPFFALLLRERGLGPETIGFVLAATSLASAAALPLWSHFSDTRLGPVRTLRLAMAATVVAAIAFALSGSSLPIIVSLAALLYACGVPAAALCDTLALAHLGADRITEYGRIRLWASVGWAIAVIALGAVYEATGLESVPLLYAAGIVAIALWTYRLPTTAPTPQRSESRLGALGDVVRESPRLLAFLAGLFLVGGASSAAVSFLGLRIVGRGGGTFLVGLAAGVIACVEIPIMAASDPLARRFGARDLFVAGAFSFVLVFAGWALIDDPLVLSLVAGAEGIAFALRYVGGVLIVGRLVPARLLASGQGLAQVVGFYIAPVVGALIGGIVYARIGPPALFAGAAAACATGAAIVWVALPSRDQSQSTATVTRDEIELPDENQ